MSDIDVTHPNSGCDRVLTQADFELLEATVRRQGEEITELRSDVSVLTRLVL